MKKIGKANTGVSRTKVRFTTKKEPTKQEIINILKHLTVIWQEDTSLSYMLKVYGVKNPSGSLE